MITRISLYLCVSVLTHSRWVASPEKLCYFSLLFLIFVYFYQDNTATLTSKSLHKSTQHEYCSYLSFEIYKLQHKIFRKKAKKRRKIIVLMTATFVWSAHNDDGRVLLAIFHIYRQRTLQSPHITILYAYLCFAQHIKIFIV